MCEANAFFVRGAAEELLLDSVDLAEPQDEDQVGFVKIFGEQKIIKGKLKSMNPVNHEILIEE